MENLKNTDIYVYMHVLLFSAHSSPSPGCLISISLNHPVSCAFCRLAQLRTLFFQSLSQPGIHSFSPTHLIQ